MHSALVTRNSPSKSSNVRFFWIPRTPLSFWIFTVVFNGFITPEANWRLLGTVDSGKGEFSTIISHLMLSILGSNERILFVVCQASECGFSYFVQNAPKWIPFVVPTKSPLFSALSVAIGSTLVHGSITKISASVWVTVWGCMTPFGPNLALIWAFYLYTFRARNPRFASPCNVLTDREQYLAKASDFCQGIRPVFSPRNHIYVVGIPLRLCAVNVCV